jgi:hypothetical protein
MPTKRIDPEVLRMDRVSQCYMSRNSFAKSKFCKNPKRKSQAVFKIFAFLILIIKGRGAFWDVFGNREAGIPAPVDRL